MSEQQTPAKKHTVTNVALIGVALALLGGFLIWRASNMGDQSGFGFLLVLVALAFLLTALVYRIRRKD
jgi:drug/metabolite transporter (DMT)-like permease